MARFFQSFVFRNLVASTSLLSFSLSTIPHAHAEIPEKQYIVGELLFLNNVKKIAEKLQKHINKGETDQAINKMFDIKKEIELYSNIKLSTSDKLEDAKNEIEKLGAKIDKKLFKAIKGYFKKKEKKHKHHCVYVQACIEKGISYNVIDEQEDFILKYGKDNDKEVQIPARLAIGITAFLCGAFLVCVPFPYCTASGLCLIGWGAQQSAEAIINEIENNEKGKTQKELFLNFS